MASKQEILRTRLESIKRAIERAGTKEKSNHVSIQMADQFNGILEQLKTVFPELAEDFPTPVKTGGTFSQLGVCEISYLDLEMFCEQVLDLMDMQRRIE